MDDIKVSFDSDYKVRILDETRSKRASELETESTTFVEKITLFSDKVNSLVEVLESHATRIDSKKLRAIGLRMAAENETDNRMRKQKSLEATIKEKRGELDRYVSQFQSLQRIESEQNAQIEKLSNSA
mgnify:CR=1 FL=1